MKEITLDEIDSRVRSKLLPEENVETSFKLTGLGDATIIFTSSRVLIGSRSRGLFYNVSSHRYDKITSIESSNMLLATVINIREGTIETPISGLGSEDATLLSQELNKRMERGLPITGGTREDPLSTLKLRYAKGEITKVEFEEMKRDIQ